MHLILTLGEIRIVLRRFSWLIKVLLLLFSLIETNEIQWQRPEKVEHEQMRMVQIISKENWSDWGIYGLTNSTFGTIPKNTFFYFPPAQNFSNRKASTNAKNGILHPEKRWSASTFAVSDMSHPKIDFNFFQALDAWWVQVRHLPQYHLSCTLKHHPSFFSPNVC